MFSIATSLYSQQEDLSVLPYWNEYKGRSDFLYRQLCDRALAQLEQRKASVSQLKTLGDWKHRQAQIHETLGRTLGGFPAIKSPLNPVITGTLEHDGVTIEKLHFESLPGYHVTAALFLPSGAPSSRQKLPAILYCSGHSASGFRASSYQHIILNYARKGFAVLAFDPIGQGERIQYPVTGDFPGFGPTHEHSYPGAQSFISGRPPAWYFVWDGIRAIDYLAGRPEIDASRIGITGRSGGGTQAAWISALDPRIAAVASECYITSFEKLLRSRGLQDAEQNLLHGIASGIDIGDFLIARAPRPTLIISTTNDIFSIQGARDVFDEARGAWQAWDKDDHLQMVEDDAPHASTRKNREAAYAFFQKHLANPGSPADEPVTPLDPSALNATPTGNVYNSLGGESLFSLSQKHAQSGIDSRRRQQGNTPPSRSTLREKIIRLTGYEAPPATPADVVFSGRTPRPSYSIEKYLFAGPGGHCLPLLHFIPDASAGGKTFLVLDDRGKTAAAQPGELADRLASEGHEVILPDLSGFGELPHGPLVRGDAFIQKTSLNLWFLGIQTGKSLLAVQTGEILTLANYIQARRARPVTAISSGVYSSALLHAALLGGDSFSELVLINPLASNELLIGEKHYRAKFVPFIAAGSIREYDLPDLLAALSNKKILIINPVDAQDRPLGIETANAIQRGAPAHITLRITPVPPVPGALLDLLPQ